LQRIEELGGALAAIERGYPQREIEEAAYRAQRAIESGESRIVGINAQKESEGARPPIFLVDPALEAEQRAALAERKAARNAARVAERVRAIEGAARGDSPLLEPIVDALRAGVSLGEICSALREAWGLWRPPAA